MMKHRDQVLGLLQKQIGNAEEVEDIRKTAEEVVGKWVNPLSGGKEETNGLIYGLIQSGKTGVLTVSGAIGADEGYRTIIILTSDNDPLYEQTLGRVREAFPGIDIIGKKEFKDADAFLQRIKGGTCAIVTTKNWKTCQPFSQPRRTSSSVSRSLSEASTAKSPASWWLKAQAFSGCSSAWPTSMRQKQGWPTTCTLRCLPSFLRCFGERGRFALWSWDRRCLPDWAGAIGRLSSLTCPAMRLRAACSAVRWSRPR